jgi:hypothetical protein
LFASPENGLQRQKRLVADIRPAAEEDAMEKRIAHRRA